MPLVYLRGSPRGFVLNLSPNVTVPELRLMCEDTLWRFHALIFPDMDNDPESKARMFQSGIIHPHRHERGFRDFYFVQNGRLLEGGGFVGNEPIYVIFRALGGKGGFGSMLRAIGAQIEKTTNREACRDLSGRRLRDINEEQRLKNWIAQQANRENEAKNKRRMKLEKLMKEPYHKFEDEAYDAERADLEERVSDALEQGIAAASGSGQSSKVMKAGTSKPATIVSSEAKSAENCKRKLGMPDFPKKKRSLLWVDGDLSTSGDDDVDDEEDSKEENVIGDKGKQEIAVENAKTIPVDSDAKDADKTDDMSAEPTTTA